MKHTGQMSSLLKFLSTPKHENPLANLRLPLVDEYIKPLYKNEILDNHIHLLVATIIFYQTLFTTSSILAPVIFRKAFKGVSRKTAIDFHVHVVSLVQSLLITALSIPAMIESPLAHDRLFGYSPYNGFVATLALGYFIWDSYISAVYVNYFGIGFLIHGLVSACVFFSGLTQPFIYYYCPIFLLFEVSTPFLNLRWFSRQFPKILSEKYQLVNNTALVIVFFLSRIVFGWYQAYALFTDFYLSYDDPRFNGYVAGGIFFGNTILNILNIYWFSRMLKVAYATLSDIFAGQKSKEETKKNI